MRVFDASTPPLKERYAVSNDTVVKLIQPGAITDCHNQLPKVLPGARFKDGLEVVASKFWP